MNPPEDYPCRTKPIKKISQGFDVLLFKSMTMNPLLILSGFGKFEGVEVNPTEQMINIIREQKWKPSEDVDFQTFVVDCSTVGAEAALEQVNTSYSPQRKSLPLMHSYIISASDSDLSWFHLLGEIEVRIHLGVHGKATNFLLESKAYNNMTFRCPDQNGYQPTEMCIDEIIGFEENLGTALPLEDIKADLSSLGTPDRFNLLELMSYLITASISGFPVDVSVDPGRFLCNYIYYKSLRNCTDLGKPAYHALFIHVPPITVIPI
jgi:pyroglutamyl-peptidase